MTIPGVVDFLMPVSRDKQWATPTKFSGFPMRCAKENNIYRRMTTILLNKMIPLWKAQGIEFRLCPWSLDRRRP